MQAAGLRHILLGSRTSQIVLRHDAERSPEHPLRPEIPGQSQPGLEVVPIALRDRALRMGDRAHLSGEGIDHSWIELSLVPILGLNGRALH